MQVDSPPAFSSQRLKIKSSALLALAIFTLINGWLSLCRPIHFDQFKFPYKGWDW